MEIMAQSGSVRTRLRHEFQDHLPNGVTLDDLEMILDQIETKEVQRKRDWQMTRVIDLEPRERSATISRMIVDLGYQRQRSAEHEAERRASELVQRTCQGCGRERALGDLATYAGQPRICSDCRAVADHLKIMILMDDDAVVNSARRLAGRDHVASD